MFRAIHEMNPEADIHPTQQCMGALFIPCWAQSVKYRNDLCADALGGAATRLPIVTKEMGQLVGDREPLLGFRVSTIDEDDALTDLGDEAGPQLSVMDLHVAEHILTSEPILDVAHAQSREQDDRKRQCKSD
jgi:hypothetical protein